MKITNIDVMELRPRNDKQWRPAVCCINTDEGIYGYGEAAMAYGVGASAAFGMIKDLSGNIIGMDPLDNEVIWEKLYKATFGGKTVDRSFSAVSAPSTLPSGTSKGSISTSRSTNCSVGREEKNSEAM